MCRCREDAVQRTGRCFVLYVFVWGRCVSQMLIGSAGFLYYFCNADQLRLHSVVLTAFMGG